MLFKTPDQDVWSFIMQLILRKVLWALATLAVCLNPLLGAQPNIVYILLDDAGYGDFSSYGQTLFSTPNIDRMASEGMRFTRHYSGSTVCAPSRCSLMTGLHTGHTFIRGNKEVQPEGQWPLPEDTMTMPKLLQEAGYVTGAFGKWGLGGPGSSGDPMRQGFQTFFGYNCQREAHTFYPNHLWHNSERVALDGHTYSHDLIMAKALEFIRSNKGKPFFCFMPITIPHAAMHVPDEDHEPFRKVFPQFEGVIGKYKGPEVDNPVAAFAGMMTRMDRGVGDVLDLIKELGLVLNTLVMISSDNGPHKEGGHRPDFFNSNGGLRGIKRDLYEGGIRVPLIAHWPGVIAPGTETSHVSAQWDLLPTFCDLAGIPSPAMIDGKSMVPTLMGRHGEQQRHDYLYFEFHERGKKQAIVMGDWKGVRTNLAQNPDAPLELYNLAQDRGEEINIAESNPQIVLKMKALMKEAHVPSEIFPFFAN